MTGSTELHTRTSRFRVFNMRDKLILYSISMLIPVILFSSLLWLQSQRTLEEKAAHLTDESLELSTKWLDEVLNGAVRLSAIVESDDQIRNFILEHENKPFDVSFTEDQRLTQQRLEDVLTSDSRATSIWIYFPEHNQVISTRFGLYQVHDRKALQWLQGQTGGTHIRSWIYPDESILRHAGTLNDFTQTRISGSLQISFIRSIPGSGSKQYPVIIGVGYLEYTLQSLLSEAVEQTKTSLLLINQNGQPVLEYGTYFQIFRENNQLPSEEERRTRYLIRDGWLINASQSQLTGWEIVSLAPLKRYMGELDVMNALVIALSITMLILALWTAVSLTKSIHKPLTLLLSGMKKIESGQLDVRIVYDRKDEFGLMAEGFNRMAKTQYKLIRSVYEEQIAKKEAELNFLNSQINPHFLYNTLGALYSLAKKTDDALAESLLSMSRFFRMSLNQGKETTTVGETIEHIRLYIQLMNLRNPGKYCLETFLDLGTERQAIPALLVQPLVENAVKHGLELLPNQGTIRVTVTELKEHLLLMIADNGVGMNEAMVAELKSNIVSDRSASAMMPSRSIGSTTPLEGSGYALRNIYRRLQLLYDSRFTFQIESAPGRGTTIVIRLPKEGNRAR